MFRHFVLRVFLTDPARQHRWDSLKEWEPALLLLCFFTDEYWTPRISTMVSIKILIAAFIATKPVTFLVTSAITTNSDGFACHMMPLLSREKLMHRKPGFDQLFCKILKLFSCTATVCFLVKHSSPYFQHPGLSQSKGPMSSTNHRKLQFVGGIRASDITFGIVHRSPHGSWDSSEWLADMFCDDMLKGRFLVSYITGQGTFWRTRTVGRQSNDFHCYNLGVRKT